MIRFLFRFVGIVLLALVSGIVANLMNNLPLAMLGGSGLAQIDPSSGALPRIASALLIGVDLGPSFTAFGSLATLLWLLLLRRRGVLLDGGDYLRASWAPAVAAFSVPLNRP